jgi:lactate dehydrogenase-like 2-hydroxyacid dehydrogenase
MGMNPEGKKLGILGMGGIGKAIAQRVSGFEMEVLYHNRSRLSEEGKITAWRHLTLALPSF